VPKTYIVECLRGNPIDSNLIGEIERPRTLLPIEAMQTETKQNSKKLKEKDSPADTTALQDLRTHPLLKVLYRIIFEAAITLKKHTVSDLRQAKTLRISIHHPWVGGVSTDGTRADENEIGGFDELQSAYRDLDLAQMAIDLKEEVQTSLKGSVQEVTAMVSKLLTSPVNPLLSPSRDVKNPSKNRMKTPKRAETEDEEIAIEVQYIGEVDDDAQSAGEIEKANSNSRSYSSKSFTRHGGAAGQRSDEQGEQAARRGLV
jgi:hypothetical protein